MHMQLVCNACRIASTGWVICMRQKLTATPMRSSHLIYTTTYLILNFAQQSNLSLSYALASAQ